MRIRVSHKTVYRYDSPAAGVIQTLRMSPRPHDSQYILDWRIEVSEDCRLEAQEDAFGNATHAFSVDGPVSELRLSVEGEVETQDAQGVVRGTIERFPPSLYLRETPLTHSDAGLREFAQGFAGAGDTLATLHGLMAGVHDALPLDPDASPAPVGAAPAFAAQRAIGKDLAHVFIAAAHAIGIPARYIAGYLWVPERVPRAAGHAWAEAHVDGLGWVAFDPTHCLCATDAYVRVAVALDSLGATPVRGAHFGGAGETLSVSVEVEQASWQAQS